MFIGLITLCACSPTRVLTPLPLDEAESILEAPGGELEQTDARGLAYIVLGTERIVGGLTIAAAALPGLNRSPLFESEPIEDCTREHSGGFQVDYECLGYEGSLRVDAAGSFANDNGEYDVRIDGLSTREGVVVEGHARMRVEGIANPTSDERTVIAPVALVDGIPERFAGVERTAVVVDNPRGAERMACLTTILDGDTFVFHVGAASDEALAYSVRDKKNLWECVSQLEGARIVESECRTPVGQGDFAVLRF